MTRPDQGLSFAGKGRTWERGWILLYRAFILPHFNYCSQIWHNCGARNTRKIEMVNERALRYVYTDKETSYEKLLERIGFGCTLESRRIQDMLVTINNCFSGNCRCQKLTPRGTAWHLSNTLLLKNGTCCPKIFDPRPAQKKFIGCIRKVKF